MKKKKKKGEERRKKGSKWSLFFWLSSPLPTRLPHHAREDSSTTSNRIHLIYSQHDFVIVNGVQQVKTRRKLAFFRFFNPPIILWQFFHFPHHITIFVSIANVSLSPRQRTVSKRPEFVWPRVCDSIALCLRNESSHCEYREFRPKENEKNKSPTTNLRTRKFARSDRRKRAFSSSFFVCA